MRSFALLFCAAACLLPAAGAQTSDPADLVRAVREARDRLDYETAEARAREVLDRYDAFSADQLVEVHTVLAIVLHARGEDAEARSQFRAALSLDPGLTLDPVLVSPKTLALFEEVRASRTAAEPAAPAETTLRYVVLQDRRPAAALRSVLLPGWGQFYKGDRHRGWAYALGVGTASAAALGAQLRFSDAQDRYRSATVPDEIETAYDEASRMYRLRNGLIGVAALGWGASFVDALVTGAPEAPGERVTLRAEGAGVALRVRL